MANNNFRRFLLVLAVVATLYLSGTTCLLADEKAAREAKYLAVLKSDASLEKKSAACRELARIASKESVPTLAGLLGDEKLSDMARYALEAIPDPSVDVALREALGKVHGRPLLGVIGSIGVRRDANAVDALGELLDTNDDAVAIAASHALGDVGDSHAANKLNIAMRKSSDRRRIEICDGLLRIEERFRAESRMTKAYDINRMLCKNFSTSRSIPDAAWRGFIIDAAPESNAGIVGLLHANNHTSAAFAARTAMELPYTEVTATLCEQLPRLPKEIQILVINTLGYRGDATAGATLLDVMKTGSGAVELAAVNNVTHLAYAPALPALAELALGGKSDVATAARTCLANFPGKDADAKLQSMLSDNNANVRALAAEMIGQRNSPGATSNLLKAAADAEQPVRLAALKALREHASATDLPALLKVLVDAKSPTEIQAAQSAINSLIVRESAVAARNVTIVKALYGDLSAGITADVTDKVTALVKGGTPAIEATNTNFGDPALNRVKQLRIEYRLGDATTSKSVAENESLTLTTNSAPPAIADAVSGAFKDAKAEAKLALLQVLRTAGGQKPLQAIQASMADGDSQFNDTALRVLCDWPTPDALRVLIDTVKTPPSPTIKVLALRGVVRLVPLASSPDSDKFAMLKQVIARADDVDEKRLVLSALANVPTNDALTLVASYLDEADLKEEAAIAAVAIAEHIPHGDERNVVAVMNKVAVSTAKRQLAAKARAIGKRAKK